MFLELFLTAWGFNYIILFIHMKESSSPSVLVRRYLPLVARTSYRILCDLDDCGKVTGRVGSLLLHRLERNPHLDGLGWRSLRLACVLSRVIITGRRIRRVFGISTALFVTGPAHVDGYDDYTITRAWELYCRTNFLMTPLQQMVYTLCELEGIPETMVSGILATTSLRISLALQRARSKVRHELAMHGRDKDYRIYVGFIRRISEHPQISML